MNTIHKGGLFLAASIDLVFIHVYEWCDECGWTGPRCTLRHPVGVYSAERKEADKIIEVMDLRKNFKHVEVKDKPYKINGHDWVRPKRMVINS